MKRLGCMILGAFLLQACQTRTDYAPVYNANGAQMLEQNDQQKVKQAQTTYEVLPGESLYSISKRFDMDYHDLARINKIEKPFYIHAGQVLLISEYDRVPAKATVAKKQAFEYHAGPAPKSSIKPVKKVQKVAAKKPAHTPLPVATSTEWMWPVQEGYVAKPYSARNKGLDIGVERSQAVIAARAGSVVYAGVALSGAGDLIIIKHADDFLTAYTNATGLLVSEGDSVKGGQKIASIKSSAKPSLHFDIRKHGKSVNPMEYVTEKL